MGTAAVGRRKAGGKVAVGRASATVAELAVVRKAVKARARGWCEIFPGLVGTDLAHIIARSQGGPDQPWNLLWLSRAAHRLQERPFAKGRLVFTHTASEWATWRDDLYWWPSGVRWQIERRAAKRSPLLEVLGSGVIDLRVAPIGGDGERRDTT